MIEVEGWPAVAAGCAPDLPAMVVRAQLVVAATPAARSGAACVQACAGGRPRAGVPGIAVVEAEPGRDAEGVGSRGWFGVEQLAPEVEVLGAGALCVATRGPSRYFGGDSALASMTLDVVATVVGEVGCRGGVADGLFAAKLAARGCTPGEYLVVPAGGAREWLAPYPVGALGEVFEELSDLLRRLGVHSLGELACLPEASVLGRFGSAGIMAHRLARGLDDHPLQARTPPPDLATATEIDPPEERVESVAFVAKSLADELLARLGSAGLMCTKVAIEVETEHGERLVRHWRHEGDLSANALSERTRWQLDGWLSAPGGAPTAGVTFIRLDPEEVRPDVGRQLGFWGAQADTDARAARAFARVQGILGPDAVVTAVLGGGRSPAEQVRFVAWGDSRGERDPDGPTPGGRRRRVPAGRRSAAVGPPWPGGLPGPSPALVHRSAKPAEVRGEDGEPLAVTGRGELTSAPASVSIGGGSWRDVIAWAGPWPLEERWWDGGGRRRARFQVLLEGERHIYFPGKREGGGSRPPTDSASSRVHVRRPGNPSGSMWISPYPLGRGPLISDSATSVPGPAGYPSSSGSIPRAKAEPPVRRSVSIVAISSAPPAISPASQDSRIAT